MARKSEARASTADTPSDTGATAIFTYSFSHSCGQSVQLDEVPDNRITQCPHCGDPAIVPDTLGREVELGLVADEEEE